MSVKVWTFPERRIPVPGPWTDEPDKAQWIDPTTSYDCLIVRNPMGSLCGYVGLPPGHPWHGQPAELPVSVHGGNTFCGPCQPHREDEPTICHVPEPGRLDNVWWVGFDCAHAEDQKPMNDYQLRQHYADWPIFEHEVYRTFDYVFDETVDLAQQLHAVTTNACDNTRPHGPHEHYGKPAALRTNCVGIPSPDLDF